MISREDITGIILAGGRGSRMGGVDKGLQNFNGMPMALQTLMRLSPQVGEVMINANRNLAAYESFGVPVWPDAAGLGEFSGPLAGFITGLERISRPGRRVYSGVDDVPHVLGGLGTSILTTSRGVMTGRAARKAGVGGEVLCNVW